MSIDSNLRTLTLQNPAVAALIGSRFHLDRIPDGATYPLIRSQIITDPFDRSHSGTHGGRARVQLDVYDDDQAAVNSAADALTAWLDNYKGGMGSYNVTIQVMNRPSFWEAEARLFRRVIEIDVLYFNQV